MSFLKSVGKVVKQVDKAVGDIRNSNIANTALDAVSALTGGGNNGGVVSGAVGSGDSSSSSWITSLMNTAGNLLNSGLGTLSDVLQNKYNIEKQKELAHYQADEQMRLNQDAFNKNLEMWNMENAYNSPAEQMARFEAAGLNKNLIYGQSNTAGSGPTFEAPKFDVGQYNPVDNRMQRAQLALAMEQHHAQIKNQQIENAMKLQSIQLAERNADREDKLANAQIQAMKSNLGYRYENMDRLESIQRDRLRWKQYQDDLAEYNRGESRHYPFGLGRYIKKYMPAQYNRDMGRRPTLMDYY